MGVPTGSANTINAVTFFANLTCTPTGEDVGVTSSVVLAANSDRKSAIFTNASDTDMFLSRSDTAELNKGIFLPALGGRYEINQTNLYQGDVSAICSVATKRLCIEEGV